MNIDELGRFIRELKANQDPAAAYRIPIYNKLGDKLGSMRVIDKSAAADPEIVDCLTRWRNQASSGFLTQFEATAERTKTWLDTVVIPPEDRILFMVLDPDGSYIGHGGICNLSGSSAELDNFIRGERGADPGLMAMFEVALLRWIWNTLGVHCAVLYVFSNNWIPISNHQSLGFRIDQKHKLSMVSEDNTRRHLIDSDEGDPVDYSYLKMVLEPACFGSFMADTEYERGDGDK